MTASAPITIWGRISSINVRKVVLAARWLGLEFTRIDAGKHFGKLDTPEYRSMNPNGLIPLLQHGSFTLWESNAIVRYLCARFPESGFYPQDLETRFDAERWMDWQQTTLNRASGPAFMQWIRTAPEQRSADVIAQSCASTLPLLDMLEAHLSNRSFMVGSQMTMADFPIACEVHRWFNLPQPQSELSAYPAIARWYAQIHPRPASKGVLDLALE